MRSFVLIEIRSLIRIRSGCLHVRPIVEPFRQHSLQRVRSWGLSSAEVVAPLEVWPVAQEPQRALQRSLARVHCKARR